MSALMFCASWGVSWCVSRLRPRGDIPCPRARVTFGHSPKSDQKDCLKPQVSKLPHALCPLQICCCAPHVRASFAVSFRQRTDSATAPLPLMPTPNNAFCSTVATVSGSGARGKSVRHTARHGTCSANAWERVFQSERHSALRKCKNVVFAGVLSPLSFAIERKGAVGDKKEKTLAVRQRRNFGHRNRDLPPWAKVGRPQAKHSCQRSNREKLPLARLIRISMSLLFHSFLLYLV